MRRLCVVALAVLVGFGGVGAWPAAATGGDGSGVSVSRLGGADRYATSLLIAEAVAADAGGSLSAVVLVSGERWTDAVVAVPVAGALGSPVLLTPPGELRAEASEFLQRVGVTDVVVIGPDASDVDQGAGGVVSAAAVDALEDLGISVERVAGSDPYSTSVAAAGRITPGVMGSQGRTAIVASGEDFAGALVAGPLAARGVHPVLLSPPERLHGDVAGYLADSEIEHVLLMGSTAAMSAVVESAIAATGVSVTRLAGGTLYDTAAETARLIAGRYSDVAGKPCFATDTIGVTRAGVPFDAMSAAPLLGRLCAPLVLADPERIPSDTAALLDAVRSANDTVTLRVFGGDAAVSHAAIDTYLTGGDPIAECRQRGAEAAPAEFPLPDLVAPSTGELRVAVLFMDFPNAEATNSTRQEAELGLSFIEPYLEAVSYGKLDVEVIALHKWLRAPEVYERYIRTTQLGRQLSWRASRHAVELADPEFDFSDVDTVLTVFPSTLFSGASENGLVTVDGTTMITAPLNTKRDPTRRGLDAWVHRVLADWGALATHQVGHSLGLPDLFPFDEDTQTVPDTPSGKEWIAIGFGLMEFYTSFLEDESKMLLRRTIEFPNGVTGSLSGGALRAHEMLAWNRWQLGWLDESQIRCLSGTETSVTLAPIAQPNGGVAMAAIPLNAHEVIVVESRRELGYDFGDSFIGPLGETVNFPALLHEGVLVYTVDTHTPSGRLPIKLVGDSGSGHVDGYPVLAVGESVTVRGYTITLTADTGNAHTVTIAPADTTSAE